MTEVPIWNVLAYMTVEDELMTDERRSVPEWRLEEVLRWCRTRGYDNIILHRTDDVAQFRHAPSIPDTLIKHRMGDET